MSNLRIKTLLLATWLALNPTLALEASESPQQAPSLRDILLVWVADEALRNRAPEQLYEHSRRGLEARFRLPLERDANDIKKLGKVDPGIYVSVLGLYRWAHNIAVVRRDQRVQRRLYDDLTRLVDEYVKASDDPAAWKFGARILFSASLALRNWGDLTLALEAMADADDLDPDNPIIIHATAAIYEKKGHYSSARARFQNVVDLTDSDEAHLRLALSRSRTGRTKKALQSLQQLAEGSAERWIRVLAFEEWAKTTLATGNPGGAEEIARVGLETFPDDESLAVLVAFLAGPRDSGARLIVNRLTSTPGETAGKRTPRGRYNIWPIGTLTGERQLNRLVADATPRLAYVVPGLAHREEP